MFICLYDLFSCLVWEPQKFSRFILITSCIMSIIIDLILAINPRERRKKDLTNIKLEEQMFICFVFFVHMYILYLENEGTSRDKNL